MADEKLPRPETWAGLTKDQFLTKLLDLEDTDFDGYRQMFLSAMINPNAIIAHFNPVTMKFELGSEDSNEMEMLTSDVSAATTDFVITDGETWEIYSTGNYNGSQNSYNYSYLYDGADQWPILSTGKSGNLVNYPQGEGQWPLRITGNGTIAIRNVLQTFGAGNVVRASLFYRRVR